jgi:hypothetical protein
MIESGVTGPMTGPTIAAQRTFALARRHSGANNTYPETNKNRRQKSRFLVDTQLSSSLIPSNSSRHSVTSRIQCNSRFLNYLTFSSRHLNATLVKRNFVEKFNTFLHLIFALGDCDLAPRALQPLVNPHCPNARPKVRPESVTCVSDSKCYPSVGTAIGWWAIKDLNLGPLPCEGSALTTELIARFCNSVKRCSVDCSYSGSYLF